MPLGPQIIWSGDSEGLWTGELTPPASVPEDFRKGPALARELLLEISSLFCIGKLHPQGWSMLGFLGVVLLPFQSPDPHPAPRPGLDCLTVFVGLPCYYIKFGFLLLISFFMSIQLIGQPTPREGEKRSIPPYSGVHVARVLHVQTALWGFWWNLRVGEGIGARRPTL